MHKKKFKKNRSTLGILAINTIHRDSELLALQCSSICLFPRYAPVIYSHCIYYCCSLQQGESWPFSLLSSLIVNLIYWKYQSVACRGHDAAAAISTVCIYCPLEVKVCNFSQNCINQGCFNHKSAHPSCIFLGYALHGSKGCSETFRRALVFEWSVPEDVLQTLLEDHIVCGLRAEKRMSLRTCLVACETCGCEGFPGAASNWHSFPRFLCELVEAPRLCIHDKCFITWEGRNSGHDPQSPVLFLLKLPVMQVSWRHSERHAHRPKMQKQTLCWWDEGRKDL